MERSGLALAVAVALLALIFWLTRTGYAPPAPAGPEAPPRAFSAARAVGVLERVLGDGAPRPLGSAANARAREAIVAVLGELGYAPEVHTAMGCSPGATCGTVHNVVARREGRGSGPGVLLAAHYDSVGSGPGAADDLSGVAALLEIARALAADPPPANPVLFLLDDGEERGLLGARAFVEERPQLAEQVGAVINLEARGSRGPSLMFETSPGNAWLIGHYAAAVERPATSSLFYTIYRRLPNDTDFTVFRQAGLAGYNFAFIGGVEHYHRPSDDLEHLSRSSLQHQGASALALTRRLAAADLTANRPGDAVYFDLLGRALVWWPAALTLPLAVLTLLGGVAVAALLLRRRALTARGLAWGLAGWPLMVLAAAAAAVALQIGLRAVGVLPGQYPWIARPGPAVTAFWALAVAAAAAVAVPVGRRSGRWGAWAGVWSWWAVLALALTLALPGASYLLLVPALVAVGGGLLVALAPGLRSLADLAPAAAAAILLFFYGGVFYDALGTPGLPVVSLVIALVATTLMPLVAGLQGRSRWTLPGAAAAVAAVAVGLLAAGPRFDAETARPLNLVYFQSGEGARWLLAGTAPGTIPEPLRRAADFAPEPVTPFPWVPQRRYLSAPAPDAALPAPELTVLAGPEAAGDRRRWRARLLAPPGVAARLHLPPEGPVEAVLLEGREVWRRGESGSFPGVWPMVSHLTVPPGGAAVEILTAGDGLAELWLSGRSEGLPHAGEDLVASLPPWTAPIQGGHTSIVARPVRLEPAPTDVAPAPASP